MWLLGHGFSSRPLCGPARNKPLARESRAFAGGAAFGIFGILVNAPDIIEPSSGKDVLTVSMAVMPPT